VAAILPARLSRLGGADGYLRALLAEIGRLRPEQRGYALTELLTVLAILTIVLAGLTALFVSASKAEIEMRKRFEAQQEARLAVDALRREVHCASGITQTGPSPTVTITLPTGCPSGSGTVTWCTVNVSANRYELYRKAGTTCDSTGRRYADYILAPNAFSYTAPTTDKRALLHVEFPVDVDTSDTVSAYTLADDLVLRNTSPTG
jgi:prepilin-type N-terminal cleavage/methylation domain-containing protein